MKTHLDKLKNVSSIHFNGEYVVIPHTKLHILRPDGTPVACRSDLHYAHRLTFLSGGRMLLISEKFVFHMIDLSTGEDLWTAPYTKNNLNVAPIVISPGEKYAYTYDSWYNGKVDRSFISQLNLETHEADITEMRMDAGASQDICCEDETTPCLLKTLIETIGGKNYLVCGVRLHDFSYGMAHFTNNWKTKWYHELPCVSPMCFFGSTDQVVTSDFHVFSPATGENINLLENEKDHDLPKDSPCRCWMDHSGRYLCVQYQEGNVIIDTLERKIAATYQTGYRKGCLIGSEYWLGTEKGVAQKPFPSFEEIPPYNAQNQLAKLTSAYYAKHPELW